MAIVKMKFVKVSSDRDHLDKMLETGIKSGMLDIEPAANVITEANKGKLLKADNPYAGYVQTLKNFAHAVGFGFTPVDDPEVWEEDKIEEFLSELNTGFGITSDSERVTLTPDDEKALDALSACGFEKIHDCRYLDFGFGRLPVDSFVKLSLYQDKVFVHHRLHRTKQYIWMVYVTSDSYAEEVREIFQSLYFEPIEIPAIDVKKKLGEYAERLNACYSYCLKQDEIINMYPYVSVYEDTKYTLSGFLKAGDEPTFRDAFQGQPVTFDFEEPNEEEHLTCPTLLKNGWFARPFELFVEMYSLPAYEDFDPTLFFAITYCLMFGIMFGDMGQGLVLLILGLVFEKKSKLFGVMARVGITSTIFGFLFGSLFGYENALNPIHQRIFNVREKLFDVMDGSNTMTLLIGAILIGAVLILCSMTLNVINQARHKRWGEVLFSQNGIAGLVFYIYLLALLATKMLKGPDILAKPIPIVLCAVIPVICFVFKEPFTRGIEGKSMKPSEGWGGYITQNIFELFEICLSFVTNSMSYLRVGGFVLSHAGMMLVVMTLVEMTGKAGPLVLVFGNIFVMCLEGLVVGIQSLRLEYYEMFSRYFTGGGRKFVTVSAESAE